MCAFMPLSAICVMRADLMSIWLCIKFLTLGRVIFGATRLFGKHSPLMATKRRDEDDEDD